jgi:hypothetical protein
MSFVGLFWHVVLFFAPAAWVALALGLVARYLGKKRPSWHDFYATFAMVFGCGGLTSLLGLWWLGNDGKMATYAVLVFVCASVQWAADQWNASRRKGGR